MILLQLLLSCETGEIQHVDGSCDTTACGSVMGEAVVVDATVCQCDPLAFFHFDEAAKKCVCDTNYPVLDINVKKCIAIDAPCSTGYLNLAQNECIESCSGTGVIAVETPNKHCECDSEKHFKLNEAKQCACVDETYKYLNHQGNACIDTCGTFAAQVQIGEQCKCLPDYSTSTIAPEVCSLDCLETGFIAVNHVSCIEKCGDGEVVVESAFGSKQCICDTTTFWTVKEDQSGCQCIKDYSNPLGHRDQCVLTCKDTGARAVDGKTCVTKCEGEHVINGTFEGAIYCKCEQDFAPTTAAPNTCSLACRETGYIAVSGDVCVEECGVGQIGKNTTEGRDVCECDEEKGWKYKADLKVCKLDCGVDFLSIDGTSCVKDCQAPGQKDGLIDGLKQCICDEQNHAKLASTLDKCVCDFDYYFSQINKIQCVLTCENTGFLDLEGKKCVEKCPNGAQDVRRPTEYGRICTCKSEYHWVQEGNKCVCDADYSNFGPDLTVCVMDCLETGYVAVNGLKCLTKCGEGEISERASYGANLCKCDVTNNFELTVDKQACTCAADYSIKEGKCVLDCHQTGFINLAGTGCVQVCLGAGVTAKNDAGVKSCVCNTDKLFELSAQKDQCQCKRDYSLQENTCILDCKETGFLTISGVECAASCIGTGVIETTTNLGKQCACDQQKGFIPEAANNLCVCPKGTSIAAEQGVCKTDANNMAMIVGLSVGIPVALIIAIIITLIVVKKRKTPAPEVIQVEEGYVN